MSQAAKPSVLSQDQADVFTLQLLRYLDGDSTADEVHQLQEQLTGSAEHRALFVRVCGMLGCLHENYATRRAELQAKSVAADAATRAGRSAVKAGAGAAPGDRSDALTAEHDVTAEMLAGADPGDPGVETIVHDASPDDTVNPAPPRK